MATPELALIPTGYKAGKVYSVLPETGVGDFAFTRASAATRINSAGLLEVVQYSIGSDVVTNGSFSGTASPWTLQVGWSYDDNKVSKTLNNASYLLQSSILTVGKAYKVTFTISNYVSGSIGLNSIWGINNLYSANGTYEVIATTTSANFYMYSDASFVGSIDNVSVIEQAINDVPRLEYPLIDGVVNGCPSLLLENQATNLITYPISFANNYWTKSGATIEGDPSTAGAEQVTDGNPFVVGSWGLGGGFSVASGDLVMTAASNLNTATQTLPTLSQCYMVVIDVTSISGGIKLYLGGGALIRPTISTAGIYTIYVNEGGVNDLLKIESYGVTTAVINSISVKEVQGYSSPSVDFPTSGFKLVEGTSTAIHDVYKSNFSINTERTFSIIAKKGERDRVSISDTNYTANKIGVIFNLNSGIVESNQNDAVYLNPKIVSLADGWYKCSVTWQNASLVVPTISTAISGTNIYTGDGTSGVYVFMAQLETGSYATSPTLTSLSAEGTTTTRVAEVCTGAGNASTFNDSEGVLMAEISALANDGTNRVISISSGAYANSIRIQVDAVANTIGYRIVSGGSISAINTYLVSDATAFNKIVVKYKINDFALWINGIEVATDISGAVPIGLNTLDFNDSSLNPLYGKTKQIQYFQTVLTDAELETLTSWTSFISMANAQQYNII